VIPKSLYALRSTFHAGQLDCATLEQVARNILDTEPELAIEYLDVVDSQTLKRHVGVVAKDSVVLFAGIIDGVRLIDNIELKLFA
jgi:pantoate--beta-alanine ligase